MRLVELSLTLPNVTLVASAVIFWSPKNIELPDKCRSFHRWVGVPKSYVKSAFGIRLVVTLPVTVKSLTLAVPVVVKFPAVKLPVTVAILLILTLLALTLPVMFAVVVAVMLVNAPELAVTAPIAPENDPLKVLAATFLVAVMFPVTVNKLVTLLNARLPVATNTPEPSLICI